MTRTDIHSPKNLITEDYDFFGCGYFGSAGDPGFSPLNTPYGRELIDEGWHFGDNESAGDCFHCGAHLKYYAILMHRPTHTLVRVGETCLDNRFERSSTEFHELRKRAALDRQAQRVKKLRNRWFAVKAPDAQMAYDWANYQVITNGAYGYDGMRHSFVSKINREGEVSDKFLRAIMRDMARTERYAEERAERDAREAAEPKTEVPEGRIQITGTVLTTRWQDNQYGGALKMLVKDDRGFKVWGSVPAALGMAERDSRVKFVAKVTRSNDDEYFGFFSRPTQADFVNDEEE